MHFHRWEPNGLVWRCPDCGANANPLAVLLVSFIGVVGGVLLGAAVIRAMMWLLGG